MVTLRSISRSTSTCWTPPLPPARAHRDRWLTSRELLELVRGFDGLNLVGADIVEVAPAYDHAELTGIAAACLAYEFLASWPGAVPRMSVPAVPWPNGARCAASFSFDVDAESAMLGVDTRTPTGCRRSATGLRPAHRRTTAAENSCQTRDYVDVLRARLHRGALPGRDPLDRRHGHEVAHHGYLHEPMRGLTEAQEAAILDRGLEALESVTGTRPMGYRAPMWELNWHSPKLLRDEGFCTTAA